MLLISIHVVITTLVNIHLTYFPGQSPMLFISLIHGHQAMAEFLESAEMLQIHSTDAATPREERLSLVGET